MGTQQQIDEWLHEGIAAAKSGQYDQARFRLLDVVEQDQTNEAAWFWLYQIFDRVDDKRICLENLILINPHNEWARQELLSYLPVAKGAHQQAQAYEDNQFPRASTRSKRGTLATLTATPPFSITLKLVAAFWFGISFIFLGGGIIAAGQWLVSGLSTGVFPNYITILQLFELFVAITFVMVGLIGINVAVGLYSRSMFGFYGSLLLALGLLLVGPIISLITTPPNYLALVCTGGISGMIVLLTLASHPGFKDTRKTNGHTLS